MYTGSVHKKQPRNQVQKVQISIISIKESEKTNLEAFSQ